MMIPIITRLWQNLHGNTDSMGLWWRFACQYWLKKKAIQATAEAHKGPRASAVVQERREAAWSKPLTISATAESIRNVPTKSMFWRRGRSLLAILPWFGKSPGTEKSNRAPEMTPRGTLLIVTVGSQQEIFLIESYSYSNVTYLSKNTHLHVDFSVMSPPNIGPIVFPRAARAMAEAVYKGYFTGGTSSYSMTEEIEYRPEPPIPWNARHTILNLQKSGCIS